MLNLEGNSRESLAAQITSDRHRPRQRKKRFFVRDRGIETVSSFKCTPGLFSCAVACTFIFADENSGTQMKSFK